MSELGPVTFGQKDEYVFLGKELHEARNYSEATAAKIDEQISKLMATARSKAEEILHRYQDKLEVVAQTLMQKETIDRVLFEELMGAERSTKTSSDRPASDAVPGEADALGGEPRPAGAVA
jgi:cell division protease FtsH